MEIKTYKKINLTSPVLIAGWPGMGNVALGVVDYLQRKLKAREFAEIEFDSSGAIDAVLVEDGIGTLPPVPRSTFYYSKEYNLVIFIGEAQFTGELGVKLLHSVLKVAESLKVKRIYTGAAFPMPLSIKEPSKVYGVVNKKALLSHLDEIGVRPMEDGQISGLNGLLLGYAEKRDIESICLLATIPQYTVGFSNPKGSRAIIEVLSKALGILVDLGDLDRLVQELENKLSIFEEKISKNEDQGILEREDRMFQQSKDIPDVAIKRIEALFEEAKKDKTKAILLKRELDRWDLYKIYEDRFLDLFKKEQ